VRLLLYLGGLLVLSIAAARVFQSLPVMSAITSIHRSKWIAAEQPLR
jgi:hypothetical protein